MATDDRFFKVLIAVTEDSLRLQLTQNIKKQYGHLNIQVDVVEGAKRALSEFSEKRHSLLLISQGFPGMTGQQFVAEIRKKDGGVGLLVFGDDLDQKGLTGIPRIHLPVVNWTEFFNRFEESIPEDIKAKLGLNKRDHRFYEKLREFGKKYVDQSQDKRSETFSLLVCIPRFFDYGGQSGGVTPSTSQEKMGTDASSSLSQREDKKIVYIELSPELKNRYFKLELGILVVLLGTTGIVYFLEGGKHSGSFFSLRTFLTVLTLFSFLGFFLSKAFDRFVLGRERKDEFTRG